MWERSFVLSRNEGWTCKVSPSLEGLNGCRTYNSCHFRRTWSAWGGVSRGLDRQECRMEEGGDEGYHEEQTCFTPWSLDVALHNHNTYSWSSWSSSGSSIVDSLKYKQKCIGWGGEMCPFMKHRVTIQESQGIGTKSSQPISSLQPPRFWPWQNPALWFFCPSSDCMSGKDTVRIQG